MVTRARHILLTAIAEHRCEPAPEFPAELVDYHAKADEELLARWAQERGMKPCTGAKDMLLAKLAAIAERQDFCDSSGGQERR